MYTPVNPVLLYKSGVQGGQNYIGMFSDDWTLEQKVLGIMKTCLYNFDPLKPHFYIVKLGFTLFSLFLLKNIDCGYLLELPRRGDSNEYTQSMF